MVARVYYCSCGESFPRNDRNKLGLSSAKLRESLNLSGLIRLLFTKINLNGLDLPIWFLKIILVGLVDPSPPAMDRVKRAQNCINNQIITKDALFTNF